MTAARLEDVRKIYRLGGQEIPALDGVSLEIREGEMAAIIGPSGSGKSTLMHLLGCLDTPTSGRLEVCGHDLSSAPRDTLARIRNRQIGFVFQSFNLLPRLNVIENIALPLVYAGVPAAERVERAVVAARRLGLEERLHNRPSQLSGGQCQRVAIARALVNNPRIILGDEPTGNLDSATGAAVLGILHDLHREGKTVVLVTHDRDVASAAPRQIEIRDGRISRDSRT
ncbi:MAG: ABC transporter ATP-binding protein [Terrimicrobiaceae bacterium]|nr:ABC transporter ATP-binding protein [Terrimicrobiaceae bacterium]